MKLVFLLWLLYFLQGIPYGFQTKFLPVFLRSYSLSLTLISLTRLLSLPWLLKPLWAPLVDKYGTKISWVKYNLFGMAVCYLVASCMSLSRVSLTVLVVACLNIMAATQDIAVDSLFVNHLTHGDIGLGNIAQVVGYKTGALFGGGFLGWLSSLYPWQQLFFLLCAVYAISALLICSPFFINLMFPQKVQPKNTEKTPVDNEKTSVDNVQSSKHVQSHSNFANLNETCENVKKNGPKVNDLMKSKEHHILQPNTVRERRNYQDTVHDGEMKSMNQDPQNSGNFVKTKLGYLNVYENVLKSDGTKWTIVYVLIYKLGEQGMIAILPMFLMDQGMSSSDTAMLTGVFCQFCSIFGSLVAGVLFYWSGLQSTLTTLSIVRFLSACVLTWLGFFNTLNTHWIGFVVSDCLLHLVSGMITTLTFTLMVACSQKCPRILSATHYSTLATFEVLGKLCMVSVSGTVVDIIGYTKFFVICTFLTLLPIILLKTGNTHFRQEKVVVED